MADRVGIIRHGKLIANETVSGLRAKGLRKVELELDAPAGRRSGNRPGRAMCSSRTGGCNCPTKARWTPAQDRHGQVRPG